MKIVHITSAHPVFDVRIFYKECLALKNAGHDVHLVAPKSVVDNYLGVNIHALNNKSVMSRWQKLHAIYRLTKNIPADVYHFHDPEFILFALLLKISGKKVIYDVHEDTPQESFSFNKHNRLKAYFKYFRWKTVEKVAKFFFNGFICATPHIMQNFPSEKSTTIHNFVNLNEFSYPALPFEQRENTAIYVGGIMRTRGIEQMMSAVDMLPESYGAKLELIGNFMPVSLYSEIKARPEFRHVNVVPWLERKELLPHFQAAKVGLVILHPEENFKKALPIKLFEYMAAGLPVIASDFPLWRQIILEAECGVLVDPFDIQAISDAMRYFFDHPEEAEKMGAAGRRAVSIHYNWEIEAHKLTRFYHEIVEVSNA